MTLFGKRKIRERQAAQDFLAGMWGAFQSWPMVCKNLEGVEPQLASLESNPAAAYEFFLAVVAIQMRALRNLLPHDQAERIERHIYQLLENPPKEYILPTITETGERKITFGQHGFMEDQPELFWDTSTYSEQAIAGYARQFERWIAERDMITAPANLLCMRLGLVTRKRLYQPMLVQLLDTMLIEVGGKWWKDCVENNQIVP